MTARLLHHRPGHLPISNNKLLRPRTFLHPTMQAAPWPIEGIAEIGRLIRALIIMVGRTESGQKMTQRLQPPWQLSRDEKLSMAPETIGRIARRAHGTNSPHALLRLSLVQLEKTLRSRERAVRSSIVSSLPILRLTSNGRANV